MVDRAALAALLLVGACSGSGGDGGVWDSQGADATEGPPGGSAGPAGGATGAVSDDGGDADETGGPKLDVDAPDDDFNACGCELTYIWVANSMEGTVSKIDTRTLEEKARYITRPDGAGDPSRTSVGLAGDVAVANRYGGLVKFYADTDKCQESNGVPGIQTSTGKGDVLPWGVEECRAWYTEFTTTNQRPVAWTGGNVSEGVCSASDARVWTVASANPGLAPGLGGAGGVNVYLVDGDDGSIEEEIAVDAFPGGSLGAYGGAVDSSGNLYFTSMGFSAGTLARVDRSTLDVELHPIPPDVGPYGITVDHEGRVWLSSLLGNGAARFDPDTVVWDVVPGFISGSGLAEGPDGLMFVSAGNSVHTVDLETLQPGQVWTTDQHVKGVSFDADGFLWAVTWVDPEMPADIAHAYKIDPGNMTVVGSYDGLDHPYTYSDMTGNALGTVHCPPAG